MYRATLPPHREPTIASGGDPMTPRQDASRRNSSRGERLCLFGAMGVLVYAIVTNAWVADDAYISFRTLDNFVSVHGLTWNQVDLVQS